MARLRKATVDTRKSVNKLLEKQEGEYPSNHSINSELYVHSRLMGFNKRFEPVQSHEVALLNFEKFGIRIRAGQMFANDIAGAENERVALAIGEPPIRYNSPIKGYARTPLKHYVRKAKEHPRIDVKMINEDYTSKRCSKCYKRCHYTTPQKRSMYCDDCQPTYNQLLPEATMVGNRKFFSHPYAQQWRSRDVGQQNTHMHRDKNSARSQLGLLVAELTGQERPIEFTRAGNQ